jgi:hypothetical protein
LIDFLIGLAFVLMVVAPAIVASMQKEKSDDRGTDDRPQN